MSLIPGDGEGSSMIFARRMDTAFLECGLITATYHLATDIRRYWNELPKLKAHMRHFKPDFLIAHYGSLTGFTASWLVGCRAVVIFRGSDLNPWPGRWLHVRTTHLLSHLAAFKATRIVCVSRGLRDKIWWRRSGVEVLPTGVDENVFRPVNFSAARRHLGWSSAENVVLFNGSNPAVKRLDRAIASVQLAEEYLGEPIRLQILTGKTDPDRVPLLMSAADCLLSVSDYEGSPTVVQEAMACELPVVSVDVGDVREMLAQVNPTWIVDKNPEKLGAALAECLRMEKGTRSNGRELISRCSTRSIAARIQQILEEMTGPCEALQVGV